MLVEWGGDSWASADNFMNGRTNGVATYRNYDFFGLVDGLDFAIQYQGKNWICPYISRHLLSLNPLLACCRRYSRGER